MSRRALFGRATSRGPITPFGADGMRSIPGSRQLSTRSWYVVMNECPAEGKQLKNVTW